MGTGRPPQVQVRDEICSRGISEADGFGSHIEETDSAGIALFVHGCWLTQIRLVNHVITQGSEQNSQKVFIPTASLAVPDPGQHRVMLEFRSSEVYDIIPGLDVYKMRTPIKWNIRKHAHHRDRWLCRWFYHLGKG